LSKRIYIAIISLALISFNSSRLNVSQIKDTRSVVKALYIYTFATLIDWPADQRKGDFVIGVLGSEDAVYDELNKKYSGKDIGKQEIQVKRYLSKSEINKVHILYVTEDESNQMGSLSTQFKSKSTLLVTEKAGYLDKGSVINFVVEGNKQKYEINKRNAKKHNLTIADKLAGLAVRVIE
jgi:hypothetical protein